MSGYSKYNESINKILLMIFENQNLCKYIYYNDTEKSPLDNDDIVNPRQTLIMKNIFPISKNSNAMTDKISLINVYIPTSNPYRINNGFKEVYLYIDILVHLDITMIPEGLRTYCIMDEIDKMLNGKFIKELSMKNVWFERDKVMEWSDLFYGYRMCYILSQNNNIGC